MRLACRVDLIGAGLLLLATAGAYGAARADTVDYEAYERLFGEPVTVSATGKPQRVSEAPVDITVITADQIARSGARTLPDILEFVADVDVRRYAIQDQSVSIRGYSTPLNPRVLVLLDGQEVFQDDYGFTVWSGIPVAMDEIKQIEIIKGPNSALYGFNAVSGAINIVTRNPFTEKQKAASVQAGTQSQLWGDAIATAGRGESWAIRLAAQGYRSTEFDGDQALLFRGQPHSGMVALDGRYRLNRSVEWTGFASMSSVDTAMFIDIGNYVPMAIHSNTLRSGLSWDSPFGIVHAGIYRNEERLKVMSR